MHMLFSPHALCRDFRLPYALRRPAGPAVFLAAAIVGASLVAMSPCSAQAAPATVDATQAAAAGIHKYAGPYLTLYSDATGPEIEALPHIFGLAIPQWRAYFDIAADKNPNWRARAFLMQDEARFNAAHLIPPRLPDFAHGYAVGTDMWVHEQTTDYYRRHLLLHEGVHAFMFSFLGSCGPPWYMEGMAEYLSTHRWREGKLAIGAMPQSRNDAPGWGRVRVIQDAVAARKALRLRTVIDSKSTGRNDDPSYSWRWAAVNLLDQHPRYRIRFRQLQNFVRAPDFNTRFYDLFASDWQELCEEWQLFITTMEYGYDIERNTVNFTPGKPLTADNAAVRVAADRGWQNSGLRLEAGVTYTLTAGGRYQIAAPTDGANPAKIWWCEPNGVTIRYYRGQPLGVLLAAVRPDNPPSDSTSALLFPRVIGLGAALTPQQSGTLFFKVNDSPAELADNAGELSVAVHR